MKTETRALYVLPTDSTFADLRANAPYRDKLPLKATEWGPSRDDVIAATPDLTTHQTSRAIIVRWDTREREAA